MIIGLISSTLQRRFNGFILDIALNVLMNCGALSNNAVIKSFAKSKISQNIFETSINTPPI